MLEKSMQQALATAIQPGEELLNAANAMRQSGIAMRSVAVGVTADRIVVVPIPAKLGKTLSFTRDDITGSSVSGLDGPRSLLSGNVIASVTLETRSEGKVKLTFLGSGPELKGASGPTRDTAVALQNFLAGN
jgi:hypothetical protein